MARGVEKPKGAALKAEKLRERISGVIRLRKKTLGAKRLRQGAPEAKGPVSWLSLTSLLLLASWLSSTY